MIEETAVVQSVKHNWISVLTSQHSSCHQCNEKASCSTSILSKFFGAKEIELKMQSELPLKPGDEVVVGISEKLFLGLTGLIYFVPLCALFLFAVLGQYLAEQFNLHNEFLTITFALTGFGGCYYLVKFLIENFFEPQKINPVILKKVEETPFI